MKEELAFNELICLIQVGLVVAIEVEVQGIGRDSWSQSRFKIRRIRQREQCSGASLRWFELPRFN